MNIREQIEALEGLAAVDADLRELNEELLGERQALTEKKTRLQGFDDKLTHDRQSVEEMERVRNDLMQEVRQMSLQVEKSREKLGRCRTEREANAAQREVEELRKLYRDREVEIEKLVMLIDQARGEIERTEQERENLAGELGDNEGAVATHLSELEGQAAAKKKTREAFVAKVRPTVYRRYELVRKRRGTGIAHSVEGTCSECHMLLPPMLFQQLMRGEDFGQCPSCNRILYFRAEDTSTTDGQADSQPSGP